MVLVGSELREVDIAVFQKRPVDDLFSVVLSAVAIKQDLLDRASHDARLHTVLLFANPALQDGVRLERVARPEARHHHIGVLGNGVCERPHEGGLRQLRLHVGHQVPGLRVDGVRRGVEQDSTAFVLPYMRHTIFGEKHGSQNVDVEHHVQLFVCDVRHRVQHEDAGVVDEEGRFDFLGFEKIEELISLFC